MCVCVQQADFLFVAFALSAHKYFYSTRHIRRNTFALLLEPLANCNRSALIMFALIPQGASPLSIIDYTRLLAITIWKV